MTVGIQPRREEEADPRGRAAPGRRASVAGRRLSGLGARARRAHRRQGAARRLRARFLQRLRAHRARSAGPPLAGHPADVHREGRQTRLLLLVGVPDRAQPGPLPDEHGPLRRGGGAGGRPRLRARPDPGVRGRSGPRQRRPRAAGGLLHGLAGDAGDARHRLRHSLRLRHVRAEDRRRPPGRAARQLAAAAATPGSCRATRTRRPSASAAASIFHHDRDGRTARRAGSTRAP